MSVPAIAADMGISVSSLRRAVASSQSLVRLAVQLLERRRSGRVLLRGHPALCDAAWGRALGAVWVLLPNDVESVAEEIAWRGLTAGPEPSWRIAELRAARDVSLELALRRLLLDLGVADPAEQLRLRALLDGLVVGMCEGRVAPEQLAPVLVAEATALASRGAARVA